MGTTISMWNRRAPVPLWDLEIKLGSSGVHGKHLYLLNHPYSPQRGSEYERTCFFHTLGLVDTLCPETLSSLQEREQNGGASGRTRLTGSLRKYNCSAPNRAAFNQSSLR